MLRWPLTVKLTPLTADTVLMEPVKRFPRSLSGGVRSVLVCVALLVVITALRVAVSLSLIHI